MDGRDALQIFQSGFCRQVIGKVLSYLIRYLNIHFLAFLERITLYQEDVELSEPKNESGQPILIRAQI